MKEVDGRWTLPRSAPVDAAFLTGIVVVSALVYLPGLGLYSDDWTFLALMHTSSDPSLSGLYRALLPTGIGTRPLQAAWLVILYRTFELDPLGYHVANTAMLAAIVVLFYACLRGIGVSRLLAFCAPLIFSVLPHYSTDRVWISAFQAPLSVLLYLVGLYADVRFFRWGRWRWIWKAVGTAALVGSVLAYEITAALFLLNPVIVGFARRARSEGDTQGGAGLVRFGVLFGSNVVALVLATAYKASTTDRMALLEGLLWRARYTAEGATSVAFGSYGLLLPRAVVRALDSHFDLSILGVSLLVGVLVWAYLTASSDPTAPRSLSRRQWLWTVAVGLVVFAAGYGAALLTFEIGFDTTGMNNRTAQAAALGVSITFVGTIGWVATWIARERLAWSAFRLALAGLACCGCLLVNTIAVQWVEASRKQQAVVGTIHDTFAVLPPETTVLLDGLCPYIGPGVVFETQWDVAAMLQLEYGDDSLLGDVVKPDTELTPAGVRTILYDDVVNVYPYGSGLRVLDVGSGRARTLNTRAAAEGYFAGSDMGASCAPGEEGYGARIF